MRKARTRQNGRIELVQSPTSLRQLLYDLGLRNAGLFPAKKHLARILGDESGDLASEFTRDMLHHALATVPYYRQLSVEDHSLASFPILTKQALANREERFCSLSPISGPTVRVHSGGSTGEPVSIRMDLGAQQWHLATEMYYRYVLNKLEPRDYLDSKKLFLWSHHSRIPGRLRELRLRLGRMVSRTTYFHPSFVSEATLDEYVFRINRLRPDFVSAISLPLYELVQHARKRGHRLHSPRLIFTSGTTLYPTMRDSIQEVFGCPVRDSYGSRENGLVAGECEMGRLHVFDFHTALEIVDQVGEPAMVGQEGRILLTSLHNLAMPLIRYEIGDVGVLGTGECSCGSGLPFLSRIAGRILEYFPTRDGRMVGGRFFFQLFYGHSWIKEFYVLQTDIDEMIVHFVPNPNRPVSHEDMEQITARIQQAMGSSCAVEWQEEASIPRTRHGKRLFTRSLVWEERNAALVRDMSVT